MIESSSLVLWSGDTDEIEPGWDITELLLSDKAAVSVELECVFTILMTRLVTRQTTCRQQTNNFASKFAEIFSGNQNSNFRTEFPWGQSSPSFKPDLSSFTT